MTLPARFSSLRRALSARSPISPPVRRHVFLVFTLVLVSCGPTSPATPMPVSTPSPLHVLTVAAVPGAQPQLAGWITLYEENHPGVVLEVRSDTVGRAEEAVAQGAADLALLDQEPPSYYQGVLTATRMAAAPIAVIVHAGNPVDTLSSGALAEVLSGHVGDWSEVGGVAGPVQVYLLPDSAGEVQYVARTAMGSRELAPQAIVCASAASLLRAVQADPGGIGFLAASAAGDGVGVVRVDGRLPSEADYAWQMPLFLVYGPAVSLQARDFVGYIGRVR